MRKIIIFILIVGLAIFSYRYMKTPDAKTPPKIVAFGDSLIRGLGASEGHDFISLVSKNINVPIQNLGVNGDTTLSALARVQSVLDLHPDIVILLLGGNDALRSVPLATTETNLRAILNNFKDKDIDVLLLGIRGGLPVDPYAPMFRKLAAEFDFVLVPNILQGVFGRKELMVDPIHPNDAGYKVISDRVTPALEKMLER